MQHDRILREPEVRLIFGYGGQRTTWDQVARGLLPPTVKVSAKVVGWPASEITAIFNARVAGADDTGIRKLVQQLVAARKALMPPPVGERVFA